MNRSQIEDECWKLADAYRDACAAMATADARLFASPKDSRLRDDRFEAGMDVSNAWEMLMYRTLDLMAEAGFLAAAEIRQAALKAATTSSVLAFRSAMQEASADAA